MSDIAFSVARRSPRLGPSLASPLLLPVDRTHNYGYLMANGWLIAEGKFAMAKLLSSVGFGARDFGLGG